VINFTHQPLYHVVPIEKEAAQAQDLDWMWWRRTEPWPSSLEPVISLTEHFHFPNKNQRKQSIFCIQTERFAESSKCLMASHQPDAQVQIALQLIFIIQA
jgi:hypothetical protein